MDTGPVRRPEAPVVRLRTRRPAAVEHDEDAVDAQWSSVPAGWDPGRWLLIAVAAGVMCWLATAV